MDDFEKSKNELEKVVIETYLKMFNYDLVRTARYSNIPYKLLLSKIDKLKIKV
jgi:DNA-binding NtrC family response regulator